MLNKARLSRRELLKRSGITVGAGVMATPFSSFIFNQSLAKAEGISAQGENPFGPLGVVRDEATGLPLLQLPAGFRYQSFSWTGDIGDDGTINPGEHDGMAVTGVNAAGELIMIRNHEVNASEEVEELGDVIPGLFAAEGSTAVYDVIGAERGGAPGGCSVLTFSGGQFTSCIAGIGGTIDNCAGGLSPNGSWLTGEEEFDVAVAEDVPETTFLDHGFVFEVTPDPTLTNGNPILRFGRMEHEAVAQSPSGLTLMTEDNFPTGNNVYLFIPDTPGVPALGSMDTFEGTLHFLRVVDTPNADLANNIMLGDTFAIEFVPIPNGGTDIPSAPEGSDIGPEVDTFGNSALAGIMHFDPITGTEQDISIEGIPSGHTASFGGPQETISSPMFFGLTNGGAIFRRPEGVWFSNGVFFFADTDAGLSNTPNDAGQPAGTGIIWALTLDGDSGAAATTGTLEAIFVGGDSSLHANPDNITIHPTTGALFFCEDSPILDVQRLQVVLPDGDTFVFAMNNITLTESEVAATGRNPANLLNGASEENFMDNEWAGATFSPDGNTLFVNIQQPGITFAITGPFNALLEPTFTS